MVESLVLTELKLTAIAVLRQKAVSDSVADCREAAGWHCSS